MDGKDDEKYIALMNAYKSKRREMGAGANKYLNAAVELRKRGNVSENAVLGAAYL
jgi:hypothetical protein